MVDQTEWVSDEVARRRSIWKKVHEQGGPRGMSPSAIRELGLYGGMAGIYRDKANSAHTAAPEGLAITLLHTGRSYADDLSDDGLLYHYPSTSRPGSTDEGEIEAARSAHRLGVPVFVSAAKSKNAGTRDLHLGYIVEFDDDLRVFLVTFVDKVAVPVSAQDSVAADDPFQLLEERASVVLGLIRKRPNQHRFSLRVMQRYGRACAVCDLTVQECVQAAHLTAKKDRGSDDPRNGLPLCANHHLALDADLWAIDPGATEIVTRPGGPSAEALGMTRQTLLHLPELPHDAALADAWARWIKKVKFPGS